MLHGHKFHLAASMKRKRTNVSDVEKICRLKANLLPTLTAQNLTSYCTNEKIIHFTTGMLDKAGSEAKIPAIKFISCENLIENLTENKLKTESNYY